MLSNCSFVLPPRRGYKKTFSNQDEEIINKLVDLGYEKEKCKKALKLSFNNIDRALEYLTTDSIPEDRIEGNIQILREKVEKDIFNKQEIPQENKEHHESAIDFTYGEKECLNKIIQDGFDFGTAIQVFLACGLDEILTRSCLRNMTN